MRGNLERVEHAVRVGGSIPAYAGEPRTCHRRMRRTTVYPRVCGGTPYLTVTARKQSGLSPRMRGNRQSVHGTIGFRRSIPAYAGEPILPHGAVWRAGVYPRVCGGTGVGVVLSSSRPGLSPRMRGNPGRPACAALCSGSIPAYAGEPRPDLRRAARCGVYPRVCGGTAGGIRVCPALPGLSPRMRGNRISG